MLGFCSRVGRCELQSFLSRILPCDAYIRDFTENDDTNDRNRYTESLPIFYGSNEFRFAYQEDICNAFPARIPSLGLPAIRRLTLWWGLENNIQPHMSRTNKARYDSLWNALRTTFSLLHIRIYIDCPNLGAWDKMPKGVSENNKNNYIQHAWLDGVEAMVEANEDLEVLEVHFYHAVYRVLKEKVKPWLGDTANKRRGGNSAVKYKAYKCGTTTIKRQVCLVLVVDMSLISRMGART